MQALVYDGVVRLGAVPDAVPEPHEALIRVEAAGICGTDLQIAQGYADFSGTLGHEFVGEVEDAEVAPQWAGRRVVAEINLSCGRCQRCRAGHPTHCSSRSVLGVRGRSGCFAEHVCVPVSNLHEVPHNVSSDAAVFTEPLAAAFRILEQTDIETRSTVAVWGDGRLGLVTAMALATTGCRLTVVGKHPHKLAIARRLGATVRHPDDAIRSDFDLVVEATGSAAGLAAALHHVRPLGTLVLKSTLADAPRVDTSRIVVDEIRVLGSRCGPFERALHALADGSVDPTPLIEARYPLSRADQAFEHARRSGTLKVLIEP